MKNNKKSLRECLFDVKGPEIIVGDGPSSDDTPPLLAKDLLLVRLQQMVNHGASVPVRPHSARFNRGSRQAHTST